MKRDSFLFVKSFEAFFVSFEKKSVYLVDPASNHMLVSKIKPCMSKYKHYTAKLRMAHYISFNLLVKSPIWITVGILELIHAISLDWG